jgi:hypothetical protein
MRTDIHRPSAQEFDPQAYDLIGCFYAHSSDSRQKLAEAVSVLEDNDLTIGHGHAEKCGHCGQNILYSALLVRDDSVAREYIFVGEQCLGNRFTLAKEEFQKLRKAAELGRSEKRASEKLAKFLDSTPFAKVLFENGSEVQRNAFLSDLRRKLVHYGDLSPRQVSAGQRALDGAVRFSEVQKKRAEEKAALAAAGVVAPEGRVEVEGEVVSIKWREGAFRAPGCYKIVVKTAAGWSCWVTPPKDFERYHASIKGEKVKFSATLVRSDSDKAFAFGKRPTGFESIVRV